MPWRGDPADVWGKVTGVTGGSGAAITDAANVANINPIRYRGYYYDTDTSLYYCQSRYYDPEVSRWINVDSYISTGQGIVGCNMFAYCMNNPVNASDSTGQFPLSLSVTYLAYLLLGGTVSIGSVLFLAKGLSSIAANPPAFPTFAPPKFESKAETEEKSQTIDIAPALPEKQNDPIVFPENPYDFNPIGLVQVPRAGTKNGAIISWMDPTANTEIFRWDENINFPNGPHYHVVGTPGKHYIPGVDYVPEPYASIYFPLM